MDDDDDIDILGAGSSELAWWENNGEEEFEQRWIVQGLSYGTWVSAADLDADGDIDVMGTDADAERIFWMENDGELNFEQHNLSNSFGGANRIMAVDMDLDNDLDILGAGYYCDTIAWWESDLDPAEEPNPCDLIAPVNDSVLVDLSVGLQWTRVPGPDEETVIQYQVQCSSTEDFADFDFADTEEDTFYVLDSLDDDSDYWWRVLAIDPESELSTLSNQTWRFMTAMPEAPGEFCLLEPENNDTLSIREAYETHLTWLRSIDPDPGDTVSYFFNFTIEGLQREPVIVSGTTDEDTTRELDLRDILDRFQITNWEGYLAIDWFVRAASDSDTVDCAEPFTFYVEPNSDVGDYELEQIPSDFKIIHAYPNPFNSVVNFTLSVPNEMRILVSIYDLQGRLVEIITEQTLKTGYFHFNWQPSVSPGVYLLTAETNTGKRAFARLCYIK